MTAELVAVSYLDAMRCSLLAAKDYENRTDAEHFQRLAARAIRRFERIKTKPGDIARGTKPGDIARCWGIKSVRMAGPMKRCLRQVVTLISWPSQMAILAQQ